jgi:hypothetical protein
MVCIEWAEGFMGAVAGALLGGMLVFFSHLARVAGATSRKPEEFTRVLSVYIVMLVLVGILVRWFLPQLYVCLFCFL